MTFEQFKTILLTILVLISLILTYLLWTFQPNYEQLEQSETVEKVTLASERKLSEVVQPFQVISHIEGEHLGAYHFHHFKDMYALLLEGTFTLVTEEEAVSIHEPMHSFIENRNSIEFVYPIGLSSDVIQHIFHVNGHVPSVPKIDRIIIFEETRNHRTGTYARFISLQDGSYLEAQLTNQTFANYEKLFDHSKNKFYSFIQIPLNEYAFIYLPNDAIGEYKFHAYPTPIPEHELIQALFPDPNVVRESSRENGLKSYTDGNTELKIYLEDNYSMYINPTRSSDQSERKESPLLQAFRFVNNHGGFTESFLLTHTNELLNQKTEINFGLQFNGLPAFDARLGELRIVWQHGEVFEYERSMESIADSIVYEEPERVELFSGEELMTFLENSQLYDIAQIKNITLGYTINEYVDYVVFSPNWYIFYDGKWEVILREDGALNGGA